MGSMGLMGVRGESGGSDARRGPGDEAPIEVAMKPGEEGSLVDASDSRRGFRRIPPRGALSGEEKDGLGGISSEGIVGEMPNEVMCPSPLVLVSADVCDWDKSCTVCELSAM